MTLDFVVYKRSPRGSGRGPRNRAVVAGTLSGLGIASLILLPRSIFGGSLLLSALPTIFALALLVTGAIARGTRLRIPRGFWVFSAVVVSGYVGALFTGLMSDTAGALIVAMIPFWLLCGNLVERERQIALRLVTIAALIAGLIVIMENLLGTAFFASDVFKHPNPLLGGVRGKGTLPHPLIASFVFLIVWMMALRVSISVRAKVVISVVFGWAIVATGSSSALLVAVAMLAWIIVVGQRGSAKTGRVLGFVVLSVVAYLAFPSAFSLTDEVSPESNMHRVNSILAVPRLLFQRPIQEIFFGSGWGAVRHLYDSRVFDNDRFYAIDNQFVAMLALGGILGFVAYVALIIGVLSLARERKMVLPFIAAVAMGLSFDFIFSPVVTALFVFVATWALGEPDSTDRSMSSRHFAAAPDEAGTRCMV